MKKFVSVKKFSIWPILLVFVTAFGCDTKKADTEETSDADRPNIIVILADDLGFSDLGCYGGEIQTPNIDKLASNGMRFTQFYNAARCCPSRASLLTGLYPHQAGIGQMTMDAGLPGYRGYLTENTVTIAEVLKEAGYNTGMSGKWHVSETQRLEPEEQLKWLAHQENYGPFSDTATYPTSRGFDKFYGTIWGVVDYFDPFSLVYGKDQVMEVPKDFYYTDAISDSAIAFVEDFEKDGKPFFLYVAYTAPHWPLQALPEDIAKYEDTYKDGWQAVRERRYQRMKDFGLFDDDSLKLPTWMFPKLHWEENEDKEWDARAMAVHAAMVDRLDQGVGRLVKRLDELGELDNTLILFLSDNGASPERPSKFGPGFDRAGSTRGGQEVHFPVDKDERYLPGPQTVHSGIGPAWAHVVNAPFRYWKSKVHEGGITTPLIAHWPKEINQKNSIIHQQGHIIDFMATCLDVSGATYPAVYDNREITPYMGTSLLPLFKEGKRAEPEYIFWEHFGSKAIRKGNWKLVALNEDAPWELYDLSVDRTETHDLSSEYPEMVSELEEKWNELAVNLMVQPKP